MLELGILKTWNSTTRKAGVQLAGSLTTYLDNISVSVSIASSAMVVGNYVLVAIPGGNPLDACVVASWPAGSSGITDHGELDGLADDDHSQYLNVARHDLTARHPLGDVVPHESALNNIGNVNAPSPSDDQALAWDAATSKWIAQTLGGGGGGSKIQDADGDTYLWVEKTADEDKIHGNVKGVEAFLLDDVGILTLAKQSSAGMSSTVGQSVATNTWTKVDFNAIDYDIQDEADISTDKITVKKAGTYLMFTGAAIYSMPDGSELITNARVNGSTATDGRIESPAANRNLLATSAGVKALSAADYIEAWVYQSSGSTMNLSTYATQNFLRIAKIA